MRKRQVAKHDLPPYDTIEISVFGPLYGECIVIHYGGGKWLTIDSCLEKDGTPSALAYFKEIGVDVDNVTHTILTHPDGDHVGGISKLYSACKNSRLVCSSVLSERTMVAYATYYSKSDPTPLAQKTRELYDTLSKSLRRAPKGPVFVVQDRQLINNSRVRLTALSPSDAKIQKFLGYVAMQIPMAKSGRSGPGQLTPNEVSAVILLESSVINAVLGADLEEDPGQSWSDLMQNSVAFRNASRPSFFKIAHHGSENADCPAFWNHLLHPTAVLAPFKYGRHKIPTQDDVARILAYTKASYSTGTFKGTAPKRISVTDRSLARHGIIRSGLFAKNGHVRFRVDNKGIPSTMLFGAAAHLSRVH